MDLYTVQIQLSDDNKGRHQYETIDDVSLSAARHFVEDWKNSGYEKPRKFETLTVESVTGGSYSISPLNVFGIKVIPTSVQSVSIPVEPEKPSDIKWQFKFTYSKGVQESAWCDVLEQDISWSDMMGIAPISKVSFRKTRT